MDKEGRNTRLRAAVVSIVCNVALVCIKLVGSNLSGSKAMQADAFHSLSDVLVSGLVLFAVFVGKKHKRRLRIENVVALVISFLIIAVAISLLFETLTFEEQTLERLPLAITFIWVCILTSYGVARYKIHVGLKFDSPSLAADGRHSMMDMYSSVAVLVGLLGSLVGLRLDALATLVVALLILRVGVEVLVGAVDGLIKSDAFTIGSMALLGGPAGLLAQYERVSAHLPCGVGRLPRRLGQCVSRRKHTCMAVVVLVALGTYAASGFYRIQPDETGVLLRWGKLADAGVPPGLHYRLPSPFTSLRRVRAGAVRRLEFGFRTIAQRGRVREPAAYMWESRHRGGIYEKRVEEAIMLTGDKNEADVNLTLEYRVAPEAAAEVLFNLADPEPIVRAATESCTRAVVGTMELTEVLTTGRTAIEERVARCVQQVLDAYGAGIEVATVRLQDVHPPVDVVPAFRRVATAREDKATRVNRALGYRNAALPKAEGSARYIGEDAKAYRSEKIRTAEGDAAYFAAMAKAFDENPEAAAFAMYMENSEEVLPGLRKVILSQAVSAAAGEHPLQTCFLAGEFLKKAIRSPEQTGDY